MSSTEMKSYLSLIPISAKVRRRQNRMTILCIVLAVFLVSAIFSVADMMLRTQMNRAAGKDGSWHLQIAGLHRVRQNSWHSSRTWCAQVQERCSMRAEKRITA